MYIQVFSEINIQSFIQNGQRVYKKYKVFIKSIYQKYKLFTKSTRVYQKYIQSFFSNYTEHRRNTNLNKKCYFCQPLSRKCSHSATS